MILWASIWGTAEGAGDRWIGERAGWWCGLLGCIVVFAWALRRPARSRIKIWMLDGAFIWLRLGLIAAVVMTLFGFHDGPDLLGGVRTALPFAAGGLAIWGLQRWLGRMLLRSHLREGDLSMLPD